MPSTNVTIRMDADLKRDAEDLFRDLGLTLSGAINVFVRQAVREQALPFRLERLQPNDETRRALDEVMRGENLSRPFHSVEELIADLNADD